MLFRLKMMAGHGLYQKKVDAFDSASLALKSLEPLHLLFAAGADEKTILQQVTHLNQILLEQKILNPFEDPKGVLKETLQEKIKNLTSAENNQLSKILKTQKQKILSDWYKKNRNYFSELSSVEKQKIDKKLEQTLNRVLKAAYIQLKDMPKNINDQMAVDQMGGIATVAELELFQQDNTHCLPESMKLMSKFIQLGEGHVYLEIPVSKNIGIKDKSRNVIKFLNRSSHINVRVQVTPRLSFNIDFITDAVLEARSNFDKLEAAIIASPKRSTLLDYPKALANFYNQNTALLINQIKNSRQLGVKFLEHRDRLNFYIQAAKYFDPTHSETLNGELLFNDLRMILEANSLQDQLSAMAQEQLRLIKLYIQSDPKLLKAHEKNLSSFYQYRDYFSFYEWSQQFENKISEGLFSQQYLTALKLEIYSLQNMKYSMDKIRLIYADKLKELNQNAINLLSFYLYTAGEVNQSVLTRFLIQYFFFSHLLSQYVKNPLLARKLKYAHELWKKIKKQKFDLNQLLPDIKKVCEEDWKMPHIYQMILAKLKEVPTELDGKNIPTNYY